LNNYFKITGIINNNMIRPQETLKKTRIKLYNTLSLTALSHSTENWTIKALDARRITAAEMKYKRKPAG
jgi:DICT domain-containing protein